MRGDASARENAKNFANRNFAKFFSTKKDFLPLLHPPSFLLYIFLL